MAGWGDFGGFVASWAMLVCGWLLVFALSARFVAQVVNRSRRSKFAAENTIIAEYKAPKDLTPYELGFLYDNSFSDNELFAVLLVLAQKNALEYSRKGSGSIAFTTRQLSSQQKSDLEDAELLIYGTIEDMGGTVSWNTIKSVPSQVIGLKGDFEHAVRGQLIQKGYLDKAGMFQTLHDRKFLVAAISLGLTVIFLSVPTYLINARLSSTAMTFADDSQGFAHLENNIVNFFILAIGIVCWGMIYLYSNIVAYIFFRSAGLPAGTTHMLRKAWPDILGFREFVITTEFNRMIADPNILDPAMPLCVAFGKWPSKDFYERK